MANRESARSSPVFRRYTSIRQECYNPNNSEYPNVGGRGIRCYWDNSRDFSDYVLRYLGPPPQGSFSRLTRRDLNDDFCPGNLKWATPSEVSSTQPRCIILTYRRQKKTLHQWAQHFGIPGYRASRRYHRGWSFAEIFELRPRKD